ncbi:MAG: hypothetical protein JWP06_1159 [Candidatus Saccharibacteria bacterium]|nr:hypothetical protein [Candidatus Saccharibacteria bacterium]
MGTISLNDQVWVRLTGTGQKVLMDYLLAYGKVLPKSIPYSPLDELARSDAGGGWRVFLLSDLMTIFGPAMDKGGRALFERNTIRLARP